jgi:hypothetical protein
MVVNPRLPKPDLLDVCLLRLTYRLFSTRPTFYLIFEVNISAIKKKFTYQMSKVKQATNHKVSKLDIYG